MLAAGWLADFADVPGGTLFHDAIESLPGLHLARVRGREFLSERHTDARPGGGLRAARRPRSRLPSPGGDGHEYSRTCCREHLSPTGSRRRTSRISRFCARPPVRRDSARTIRWRAPSHAESLVGRALVRQQPGTANGLTFADVPASLPNAAFIEALAAEGWLAGCGGGNFCPNALLTRGEAAAFLARIFSLP